MLKAVSLAAFFILYNLNFEIKLFIETLALKKKVRFNKTQNASKKLNPHLSLIIPLLHWFFANRKHPRKPV